MEEEEGEGEKGARGRNLVPDSSTRAVVPPPPAHWPPLSPEPPLSDPAAADLVSSLHVVGSGAA